MKFAGKEFGGHSVKASENSVNCLKKCLPPGVSSRLAQSLRHSLEHFGTQTKLQRKLQTKVAPSDGQRLYIDTRREAFPSSMYGLGGDYSAPTGQKQ